ncbi:hypothetical protein BDZ91DRAFT_649699 [Kalaharituber pfeilii]|nr:hypothetical protein BDZ91DRAFT_649699 [Kalaharituber pfeilii]
MSTEQYYEFNVKMTCGGCSGAVNRVLAKMDGIKAYDVSLEKQTVKVIAEPTVSYDDVSEKIKKTGKEILSGKTVEGGFSDLKAAS